ncbi:hypothetical protein [Streptomyces parvus]|uniref:hypothetical protein n=1 Tax=Streptomyces parvus TaxID=66428 RepID=UPI00382F1EC1
MGRPSRLGDEDRSDYASVLDEVIASPEIRRLLELSGTPVDRLRVRGLAAVARTTAAADAEYRRYTALRLRARGAQGGRRGDGAAPLSGPGDQERPGAGVLAVLGVLTPVLAAVAAATFLLLGYGLRLAGALAALADTLVGVGWFSLAVAAATALVSAVALYRTAARQSAADAVAVPGPPAADSPALAQARQLWLVALRDRGIRPFLLQELAEAAAPGAGEGRDSRFSSPAFAGPDHAPPGFEGPTPPAPRRP